MIPKQDSTTELLALSKKLLFKRDESSVTIFNTELKKILINIEKQFDLTYSQLSSEEFKQWAIRMALIFNKYIDEHEKHFTLPSTKPIRVQDTNLILKHKRLQKAYENCLVSLNAYMDFIISKPILEKPKQKKTSKAISFIFSNPTLIDPFLKIVLPHFENTNKETLKKSFLDSSDLIEPAIFNGNANVLISTILELLNKNVISGRKQNICQYIIKNFRYLKNGSIKSFEKSNTTKVLSSSERSLNKSLVNVTKNADGKIQISAADVF